LTFSKLILPTRRSSPTIDLEVRIFEARYQLLRAAEGRDLADLPCFARRSAFSEAEQRESDPAEGKEAARGGSD
jgi:hypothetical protein